MTRSGGDVTPGGFQSIFTVMGSSKPSWRSAMIFHAASPLWTRGTFGSTMRTVNGTASTTAAAIWLTSDLL